MSRTADVDDGISDATFRTLQLVLAYNSSDWTYGWSYYMDGFSIFYSPRGEMVLDHMASVTVNSRINSVLLLAQHRTIMLGFPYSECIKDGKLTWFPVYTKKVVPEKKKSISIKVFRIVSLNAS